MQSYFISWQDRGYEGAIFPQELSLDYNSEISEALFTNNVKPKITTPSIITVGHPLYQHKINTDGEMLIKIQAINSDSVNFK